MDGFQVMPIACAASEGDIFITVTGNSGVIRKEHFEIMKDGAMVCNSGHFDVELDLVALKELSVSVTANIRNHVEEYRLKNGKKVFVIAQGRLVNLAAAEGHPPSVMDMSFATQALATEFCLNNKGKLANKVYNVPAEVENFVASSKLTSMGMNIDKLTAAQQKYMSGWEHGT